VSSYKRAIASAFCFIPLLVASSPVRHWTQTSTETLWRGRYTNCDKGYSVDLPAGVVAHDTLPPSPNDGFIISTLSAGTTDPVTATRPGFLAAFNQYNSGDWRGPQAYLDWELAQTRNAQITNTRHLAFHGLPAFEAEYSAVVDGRSTWYRVLIVFRDKDDLIYELMLSTLTRDDVRGTRLYRAIRSGFRIFPIPLGECVNP
jgi:hypothetical protein